MEIKQIYNINEIIPLHNIIFGKEFPMQSLNKKKREADILMYIYEEENVKIGYSIVIAQKREKNLYAWYGGLLPEYQGNGITKQFFEDLIKYAYKMGYSTITVATSNLRPHMIIFAVKMGFDIYDLKKRSTGEGNKIYFKYFVRPETKAILNLNEIQKITEIERQLVELYKNNTTTIILTEVDKINSLIYIIKYCNSFIRKPKLIITKEEKWFEETTLDVIKNYDGEIEFLI